LKRKDKLGVSLEKQNADDTSLRNEDESATSGDDLPEFAVQAPEGRGRAMSSLEKAYLPTSTPEEIYQAEQLMDKQNSLGELATAKAEMDEIQRLREMQETQEVPQQPPTASLPAHALPPHSPPSVPERTPQIPGAATQPRPNQPAAPQEPLNPFANYGQPEPAKPESGLPYKPKGLRKHDCLTVHGYQKHEEWEEEQEKKFFRRNKNRVLNTV